VLVVKALLVGLFCCSIASPAMARYESFGDSQPAPRWVLPLDGPLGSPFGYRWGRRHDDGFVTMYAHLARSLVERGEIVAAGELIARAGCTGSCTGVHLHFQMWHHGKLVDPVRFLGRRAFVR
jgi:hypothetical protein